MQVIKCFMTPILSISRNNNVYSIMHVYTLKTIISNKNITQPCQTKKYTVCLKEMQQKYNGMSDVECVTNIDNIGMV